MITTAEPFLKEASELLNETTTTTTTKRVGYFNRAIRRVLRVRRWTWNRRKHDLTLGAGTQTYDLSSVITDYNPMWGIHSVWKGGEKMTPIDYDRRADASERDVYFLHPDTKTIQFTKEIEGDEDIDIWYYPRWTNASSSTTELTVPLPEDMLGPVATLIKAFVHDGKRQRNDARNALLDYKEEIEEVIMQDASIKIKDLPKTIPGPLTYYKLRRTYRY